MAVHLVGIAAGKCEAIASSVARLEGLRAKRAVEKVLCIRDECLRREVHPDFELEDQLIKKCDDAFFQTLAVKGIQFSRYDTNNDCVFIINPSNATPINSLALKLFEKLKVQLGIRPSILFYGDLSSRMTVNAVHLGFYYEEESPRILPSIRKSILMPPDFLFNPKENKFIAHEVEHAEVDNDLRERKPSPSYGFVYVPSKRYTLPSSIAPYSEFFSFDEPRALMAELDHVHDPDEILDIATRGQTQADMVNVYALVALRRLDEEKGVYFFNRRPSANPNVAKSQDLKLVWAKIPIVYLDNRQTIEIPLVRSTSAKDPNNRKYLRDQLQALEKESREQFLFFTELADEAIQKTNPQKNREVPELIATP